MMKIDEDAWMCDLAETYQIYDYKQLPVSSVAVFSCGLRDDSRIKMKMSNQVIPLDTLLLANLNDKVSLLLWAKTKDGQKGINRPLSIVSSLTTNEEKEKKEIVFNSGEDFERARNGLLKQAEIGGV